MVTLICDPNNLQIVNDVASCSQWVLQPVGWSWADMSQNDFQGLLAATTKLALAGFMVWWLVWAARRM